MTSQFPRLILTHHLLQPQLKVEPLVVESVCVCGGGGGGDNEAPLTNSLNSQDKAEVKLATEPQEQQPEAS